MASMDKLRKKILERGSSGILDFGRLFNIVDRNRSQSIDLNEFERCIEIFQIDIGDSEMRALFSSMDKDGSGKLSYKEFITALRPPLNAQRLSMIDQAFKVMDVTGDGVVTVEDLKLRYNVQFHPKFVSGEWTEEKCLREFLDSFDSEKNKDGVVTDQEFIDYYSGVSSFIDSDQYFEEMMRKCWKL
ncbi:calcyphosin-like protein [Ylistrum balloti]|uniref:calcyphosin-like protein n=1 Tax=Ylistrum balloti TaxID=509963 RepID=UPI002905B030|nr:calcyphosin-like protein [Ylistrum balloti]